MQANKTAIMAGLAGVVVVGLALIVGPSVISHATKDAAAPVEGRVGNVIAVIDAQAVLNKSKAGQSIQKQLNEQREKFQQEFSKMERDLGEEEKKIAAQREKLSAEEMAEKARGFEARLRDARKLVQQRRVSLEKASADAFNKLRMEMTSVVAEEAQANGYDIVLTRQDVVLAEKEMDITEAVMTKLDKAIPDVKLDLAAAEKAVEAAIDQAQADGKTE